MGQNSNVVDFGTDDLDPKPVTRFVNLLLHQAAADCAEKIDFEILDVSEKQALHISYSVKGQKSDLPPVPGELFGPVVVILCNYASVPYWAKGSVRGRFETKSPRSAWLLESDDLRTGVVLWRT